VAAIDDLGRYVSNAEIESTLAWPLRGAHPSYMLVLAGGVSVLFATPPHEMADCDYPQVASLQSPTAATHQHKSRRAAAV